MRGQILLARRVEKIFRNGVIAVGEQRAAIVMFAVQCGGFVAIVNGQDKAALQRAARAFYPIARFKTHFRLLSFFQRNSLLLKILLQPWEGGLAEHLGESSRLKSDENFAQRAAF